MLSGFKRWNWLGVELKLVGLRREETELDRGSMSTERIKVCDVCRRKRWG